MTTAAQFAVHRSPSRNPARPLVIVLQCNNFARMPTRIVAPLVRPNAMPQFAGETARIAPVLVVRRQNYVLNPFDLATLGVHRLGDLVASFANDEDARRRIQDALDLVLRPF